MAKQDGRQETQSMPTPITSTIEPISHLQLPAFAYALTRLNQLTGVPETIVVPKSEWGEYQRLGWQRVMPQTPEAEQTLYGDPAGATRSMVEGAAGDAGFAPGFQPREG